MKIPQNLLEHFKNKIALLLVSGEFECKFFVIKNGEIAEQTALILNPREQAKEKQGYIHKASGANDLGAVSHHGAYILELKNKFYKELGEKVENLIQNEKIDELHIFIPKYAKNKIVEKFPKSALNKICDIYLGEFTKKSPIKILDIITEKIQEARSTKHIHYSLQEKNILHRPKTRPTK